MLLANHIHCLNHSDDEFGGSNVGGNGVSGDGMEIMNDGNGNDVADGGYVVGDTGYNGGDDSMMGTIIMCTGL